MSQNWEIVGKSKPATKNQKRQTVDKMPQLDVNVAPLHLTKSMFDPIDDKPKNVATKKPLQDRSNNQVSPKGSKKPKKPRKLQSSSKYRYETFEEALSDVSVMSVTEKVAQCRSRFPKNPNIWLKDIAAYLNDSISCPDANAALLGKKLSYPFVTVPKALYNLLQKLYADEPSDIVKDLLFEHCLKNMLDCIVSDQPTWGYRICIQALAHGSPKVFINNLDKHLENIRLMKNVPKRCLAYLWAMGQIGAKDPQCGMKVWLNVMLPMIQIKSLSGYVVQYLEQLIAATKEPVERLSGSVDADNFLLIMRWCFDQSTGLAPNLRERLCDSYRPIRLFATGNAKLKVLLFRRFLEASPEEIANVRQELLEVIFECLQANPQCFSVWREMYMSTLPQTKVLLEYLDARWVESWHKLPRKQFKETIRAFHNTNLDAASQSSTITSIHEFKAVNDICKQMHRKLLKESQRTFSSCHHVVIPLLVALLAIGIGMFLYDVHSHGGVVENSATYKTLEKSGTIDVMKQAWEKFSVAMQLVKEWLQVNVPYYWSRLKASLGPYLSHISKLLGDVFNWIVEVTAPARAQISEGTKTFLVMADDLFKRMMVSASEMYEIARPYLISAYSWVVEKLSAFYSLLSGEIHWCCVRDAIVGYAVFAYECTCDAALFVWSYVLHAAKMVGDYISGENM